MCGCGSKDGEGVCVFVDVVWVWCAFGDEFGFGGVDNESGVFEFFLDDGDGFVDEVGGDAYV